MAASTSYAAWDKYDVDEVLQQLDEADAREAKLKEKQQLMKKKDGIVDEAGDSAEVAATRAAVAALKAKRLVERNKKAGGGSSNAGTDSGNNTVAVLEKQARLLQRKSASIQTAMRSRGRGSAFLAKNSATDALASFHEALRAITDLDDVIPQLNDVQTEIDESVKLPSSSAHDHGPHGGCATDGNAPCSHSHPSRETNGPPSLPKSSDLKGIAKMLRVDCLLGIGKCHMERCHYAAASESFRDAILIDGDNLDAWKLRADAFAHMGAPLIALLHLNKVVAMEGEGGDGQAQLETLQAEVIDPTYNEEDGYTAAMTYLVRAPPHESLARMLLLRHEADVIMIEGFYTYSTHKYRAILDTLSTLLQATPHLHHPALDQLRLACHVNIASGYLDMHKNIRSAVNHCLAALAIDPTAAAVRYRLGHAYRVLGKFDLATSQLTTALSTGNNQSYCCCDHGRAGPSRV
ncbi:hypothetical protein H257_02024 [Aphanomyces astaci]|uniref:Uncharacterized protein n=1 Tax=Aphanomyces astaci TaxID=112090 RepID=W4H527_APHAT|nr:hypothetical protein H257_02024 [Aphanomyces astaci]ETV87012.1 hypothetical protein H257_02024 [Aphanomyces astaci]|eukprot:XP_009823811.1 hypothetical protein H257_02024 [Aphanomyces astaci]